MENNIENKEIVIESIWDKDGRQDLLIGSKKFSWWQILILAIISYIIFIIIESTLYQLIFDAFGWTGISILIGCMAIIVWFGSTLIYGAYTKRVTFREMKATPFNLGGLKGITATIGLGIIGYALNLIISVLMIINLPVNPNTTRGEIVTGGGNFFIGIFVGSFLVPIGEEFFFRGFIFTSLRKNMKFWGAALLSALCFGLVHGDFIAIVYAFVLGIIFAYWYERKQSIYNSILLHMVINLTGTILSLILNTFI